MPVHRPLLPAWRPSTIVSIVLIVAEHGDRAGGRTLPGRTTGDSDDWARLPLCFFLAGGAGPSSSAWGEGVTLRWFPLLLGESEKAFFFFGGVGGDIMRSGVLLLLFTMLLLTMVAARLGGLMRMLHGPRWLEGHAFCTLLSPK